MASPMSPSPSHPIAAFPVRAFVAYLNAVGAFVRATWKARRHRREVVLLLAFDDHALADIGLTRGDVHVCLAGPVFDDPSTRLRVLAVERRAARRAQAREHVEHLAMDGPVSISTRLSA